MIVFSYLGPNIPRSNSWSNRSTNFVPSTNRRTAAAPPIKKQSTWQRSIWSRTLTGFPIVLRSNSWSNRSTVYVPSTHRRTAADPDIQGQSTSQRSILNRPFTILKREQIQLSSFPMAVDIKMGGIIAAQWLLLWTLVHHLEGKMTSFLFCCHRHLSQ